MDLLLAAVDWRHYMFMIPLTLLSVFMMLVILVQRGRGGGLTGALGGMGGQSAFGTKAGDLFTRITIVVAAIWVLLSMASIKVLAQRTYFGDEKGRPPAPTAPASSATPKATTSPKGRHARSYNASEYQAAGFDSTCVHATCIHATCFGAAGQHRAAGQQRNSRAGHAGREDSAVALAVC